MPQKNLEKVSISKLLTKHSFEVLEYQREYSWTTKQICAFHDDVQNVFNDKTTHPKHYFFGPMVFESGTTSSVIDGQQRLATVSLLFSVIRDYCYEQNEKLSDSDEHKPIKLQFQKIIGSVKDYLETSNGPRLILNSINEIVFRDLIDGPKNHIEKINNISDDDLSNKRLVFCYTSHYTWVSHLSNSDIKTLDKKLEELKNKRKEITEQISTKKNSKHDLIQLRVKNKQLLETIKKSKVERIQIFVQILENMLIDFSASFEVISFHTKYEDAHMVFETLNERGIPLNTSDLLKNYIFRIGTKDNLDKFFIKWTKIKNNVPENLDDFLLDFYRSTFGKSTENDLFQNYKKQYLTLDEVKNLLNTLLKSSEIYKNILKPSSPYWSPYALMMQLSELQTLGSKSFNALILCAVENKFKPGDLKDLVDKCVSLFVRHKTILERNPDDLMNLTIKACELINTNSLKKLNQSILDEFKKLYSQTENFENTIVTKSIKEPATAGYIIRKIIAKHPKYSTSDKLLELEHMIPDSVFGNKSTDDANILWWRKYLKDKNIPEEKIYNIGNMVLLTNSEQKEVGNKKLSKKIQLYAKSSVKIATKISKSDFTKTGITNRSREYGKIASKIWKIDF